jgi:hypothetical protein
MTIYIGPDQVLPLSGFLGTALGVALMFWGKLQEAFRKLTSRSSSKDAERP